MSCYTTEYLFSFLPFHFFLIFALYKQNTVSTFLRTASTTSIIVAQLITVLVHRIGVTTMKLARPAVAILASVTGTSSVFACDDCTTRSFDRPYPKYTIVLSDFTNVPLSTGFPSRSLSKLETTTKVMSKQSTTITSLTRRVHLPFSGPTRLPLTYDTPQECEEHDGIWTQEMYCCRKGSPCAVKRCEDCEEEQSTTSCLTTPTPISTSPSVPIPTTTTASTSTRNPAQVKCEEDGGAWFGVKGTEDSQCFVIATARPGEPENKTTITFTSPTTTTMTARIPAPPGPSTLTT